MIMQRSWPLYPVVYSNLQPKLGTFKMESPDMAKHELKATCMTHESFFSLSKLGTFCLHVCKHSACGPSFSMQAGLYIKKRNGAMAIEHLTRVQIAD